MLAFIHILHQLQKALKCRVGIAHHPRKTLILRWWAMPTLRLLRMVQDVSLAKTFIS